MEGGEAFGDAVMPLMDRTLLSLYHRFQEGMWMDDLVEHVELAIEEAGLLQRLEHPPAVGFVDLSGYTRLTEEHGDERAADLATAHAALVQRTARRYGGQAVKFLGDGVIFLFKSASDGVGAALEAVRAVKPAGLPPAHVGMHAGPVVMRDGDAFGRTVNLAARLANVAGPREVIVTGDVVDAAADARASFESLGRSTSRAWPSRWRCSGRSRFERQASGAAASAVHTRRDPSRAPRSHSDGPLPRTA